jgi:hypothetical protein
MGAPVEPGAAPARAGLRSPRGSRGCPRGPPGSCPARRPAQRRARCVRRHAASGGAPGRGGDAVSSAGARRRARHGRSRRHLVRRERAELVQRLGSGARPPRIAELPLPHAVRSGQRERAGARAGRAPPVPRHDRAPGRRHRRASGRATRTRLGEGAGPLVRRARRRAGRRGDHRAARPPGRPQRGAINDNYFCRQIQLSSITRDSLVVP